MCLKLISSNNNRVCVRSNTHTYAAYACVPVKYYDYFFIYFSSTRLKQRVFWELKAAQILMDMLSEFPDITSEVFVLNVEAISVLANLIGLTCVKLPESETTVSLKLQSDEGNYAAIYLAENNIVL